MKKLGLVAHYWGLEAPLEGGEEEWRTLLRGAYVCKDTCVKLSG